VQATQQLQQGAGTQEVVTQHQEAVALEGTLAGGDGGSGQGAKPALPWYPHTNAGASATPGPGSGTELGAAAAALGAAGSARRRPLYLRPLRTTGTIGLDSSSGSSSGEAGEGRRRNGRSSGAGTAARGRAHGRPKPHVGPTIAARSRKQRDADDFIDDEEEEEVSDEGGSDGRGEPAMPDFSASENEEVESGWWVGQWVLVRRAASGIGGTWMCCCSVPR
jgi:hypothetical protein